MATQAQKRVHARAPKAKPGLADWTVVEQDGRQDSGHSKPIDFFRRFVSGESAAKSGTYTLAIASTSNSRTERAPRVSLASDSSPHNRLTHKETSRPLRARSISEQVNRFVSKPVPPFPSEAANEWKNEVNQLGQPAREYLLDVLFKGDAAQQYASLIALRILGDESWAEGYDDDICYFVKHEGRLMRIEPKRHITVSNT